MHHPIRASVSFVFLFALAACSTKQPSTPPQPSPVPATDSPDRDAARRDSIARAEAEREAARLDALARAERERRVNEARATILQLVHFDYDRADLSAESQRTLDAKLGILKDTPELRLRITGHTDERGSDEYNLALGQRRAASVKRYLVEYGITPNRLDIVSKGEESPLCNESDDSCWRQNRRAEFEITAGAEQLVVERSNR
ncbi:MAG: OmpA family protein [Gemmatimonadaceae bacterium]